MADTQQDSRQLRQAVVYIDDKPHIELMAEELIYPILSRDDQIKVYFHVRPYQPYAVKKFYDSVTSTRKRLTATKLEIQTPDWTAAKEFVVEHLLGMSGVTLPDESEPTLEQVKAWLSENPTFKVRLWREGFDATGPRDETEEAPAASGLPVLIFGRSEHSIPTGMLLYSRERKIDEKICLVHTLARLSESDRHQYDKAVQFIEDTRRGEVSTSGKWDVIEGLYNQRAKRLDGALLNGAPCTDANREHWIKLVPFCHKVHVMAECIREVELKNA